MIRTKAAAAALATAALLGAPLAAHAGTVDSTAVKDRKGDVDGNKKMRSAKSIDLTRVTYKHVVAGGEDHLVVQYKVRQAFGRKAGRVQSFITIGEAFSLQSHFRPNGTVDVWSDDLEETVPCEGATERIDRRRDLVTQRVPAACLGEATKGELSSAAFVFAPRSGKLALDFTDFREFSWGPTVVE
jgi:hypothetical protein